MNDVVTTGVVRKEEVEAEDVLVEAVVGFVVVIGPVTVVTIKQNNCN